MNPGPAPTSPTASKRLSKNPYRNGSLSSNKGPTATTSAVQSTESNGYGLSKNATATTGELSPAGAKRTSYPSPPTSASPRREQFPSHREEAFGDHTPTNPGSSPSSPTANTRPRRTSSLTARFPGDKSHRPLEQLTRENRVANRAPHLKAKHQIGADTVDQLDNAGPAYHHSGPYDATLLARNTSHENSPVSAVAGTNAEALKATPREKVIDSVRGHRPLDGVAAYPPGETDPNGQVYDYEQGENMMTDGNPEGGAYKRWPGVRYHPDDIKGKGEPSYSIEKALKEHKRSSMDGQHGHRKSASQEIEMTSRSRRSHDVARTSTGAQYDPENPMWGDGEQSRFAGLGRSSSGKEKRMSGGGLKKRFGSIKEKIKDTQILP